MANKNNYAFLILETNGEHNFDTQINHYKLHCDT